MGDPELKPNDYVIVVESEPDSQGRVSTTAHWLDQSGARRGQCFWHNLDRAVENQRMKGWNVIVVPFGAKED